MHIVIFDGELIVHTDKRPCFFKELDPDWAMHRRDMIGEEMTVLDKEPPA